MLGVRIQRRLGVGGNGKSARQYLLAFVTIVVLHCKGRPPARRDVPVARLCRVVVDVVLQHDSVAVDNVLVEGAPAERSINQSLEDNAGFQ